MSAAVNVVAPPSFARPLLVVDTGVLGLLRTDGGLLVARLRTVLETLLAFCLSSDGLRLSFSSFDSLVGLCDSCLGALALDAQPKALGACNWSLGVSSW